MPHPALQRQHTVPVLQVVYKEAEKSPRGALGRPACPPPRAAESKCEPLLVCGKGLPVPYLSEAPPPVPAPRSPAGVLPRGRGFC